MPLVLEFTVVMQFIAFMALPTRIEAKEALATEVRGLIHVADFLRRLQTRMRFGELSRAPLQLLRLQVWRETAECDWMARSWDEWDATLPRTERDRRASFQALQDAIAMRDMLFAVLPDVQSAEMRSFRQTAREPPELIIFGTVTREAVPVQK